MAQRRKQTEEEDCATTSLKRMKTDVTLEMKNSWNSNNRIGNLPLELIDAILQKCYLNSILRQSQSLNNQTDKDIVEQLASVDFCWFQKITRKHFKNVVWSKLKSAARIERKMSRPLTKFELIPQYFEDKEMKILRSLADRDAVVWIWCHSNDVLLKLNNCDGLKKLIEIVHQSVKATPDVLVHETNIDCDHLKKKIVSIPWIFVEFRTKLNLKRDSQSENRSSYSVIGVTKLKTRVYVLRLIVCRDSVRKSKSTISTMICAIEDRSPYPIVEEILLGRFNDYSRVNIRKEFRSIVSAVKENCLYLLKSRKKENHYVGEVIRVEIKENEENSLQLHSKWLELDKGFHSSDLFISRDGDLMMVSSSSPIILRIYDSDARIRLSVELHEDIVDAYKAVETSNGNFIILHFLKRPTVDTYEGDKAKGTNEEERAFLWTVSEVSRDGKTIIRRFIPQNQQLHVHIRWFLNDGNLCTDSEGRVFVADPVNNRVIVLDSYLRWIGILILRDKNGDEYEKFERPLRLFYDEDSHEMIATERDEVLIYDFICK